MEDDREGFYAKGRVPGRFYVSKRFPKENPEALDQRFAYEVADVAADDIIFESSDGWEVTLRETPSRQQLKAVFFESSRGVTNLAFQRFNASGEPIDNKKTLFLDRDGVGRLRAFLAKIAAAELDGEDAVRFSEGAVEQLLENAGLPHGVLRDRIDDVVEFLRSDVSAPEVIALARRRERLAEFQALLEDDPTEVACQAWLEQEPWVLGFGVAPQFLHRVGDKLEQVVSGFDIETGGARPDGLLRSAAQLSALVFVEIKRPGADLVKAAEYRSDSWVPGKEVVGGVAQLHSAVDAAKRTIGERHRLRDAEGYETGVVAELCRPRAVLVVGRLDSLLDDAGQPHRGRFRSFESYRRSLREPEIITFDELLERAGAAVTLAGDRLA